MNEYFKGLITGSIITNIIWILIALFIIFMGEISDFIDISKG